MPSYYRAHQHPLTPPDFMSPFAVGPFGNKYGFDSLFDGSTAKAGEEQLQPQFGHEQPPYHPQLLQPFTGAPPPGLTHPNALNIHPNGLHFPLPAPHTLHGSGVLNFETHPSMEQQRVQQVQQQEEPRPVGGVAAKLDYVMETMVDFVAQTSTGIIESYGGQTSPVSTSFRKFVHQMLSSTRLPRATILLGLEYLSTRCATEGVVNGAQRSQVYRMLTISLLLASKFLDDNTFQNRSWAEVTGIPVIELNQMEADWLVGMNWRLHVQPDAPKGFFRWEAMYLGWAETREAKRPFDHASLPPINTHVPSPHALKAAFSPQPLYPPHNLPAVGFPSDRSRSIDQSSSGWWSTPGLSTPGDTNSPSAPETGPTTPDQFGRLGWDHAFGPQVSRPLGLASVPQGQFAGFHPQPAMQSHNPYVQHMTAHRHHHMMWNGQPCQCGACATRHNESFFMNSFGGRGQVVVG